MNEQDNDECPIASEEQIERARAKTGWSDEIEVDEGAKLSVADDGVWVAAWIWLQNENTEGEE